MLKRWWLLAIAVPFSAAGGLKPTLRNEYQNRIIAWQQHREHGLRQPDGWLTLVGLFWLKPGPNTIGTAADNDFVLPAHSAPAHAGTVVLEGRKVTYKSGEHNPQQPVRYIPEKDEDTTADKPQVVTLGTASFTVIERDSKLALRARDSRSPVLQQFHGLNFYPIDEAWHIRAKFVGEEKEVPILNVLGRTSPQKSPGYVEFKHGGQTVRLRPIYEGKTLFFLFKDATNRTATYQAGRMMNTPLPVDGVVELDFNKAYNPPCTFTSYATCPLPPKENRLPFAVEAGEKRYGAGHPEVSPMPDARSSTAGKIRQPG